jgi:OmpA-OmpF porin, OOP family
MSDMESATKILIGAGVTALMAWGAHSGLGRGQMFVDGLNSQAESTLSANAVSEVSVSMLSDPSLKRIVILSGDKTDEEKAAALAAVRAIPGVLDARWAGDAPTVATAPVAAAAPATQEAVAQCQGDINALMAGKTINFQSGSAYIAGDSDALLTEVAAALKPCAGTKVEVQGHTDLTGSASINQTISQARAEAVMKALTGKGVPADRLTAKGYGPSQPLENAMTPAANAKNRRTVFSVAASVTDPATAPAGGQ